MIKAIVPQDITTDNLNKLGDPSDPLRNLLADALKAVMQQEEVLERLNADAYERHDDRTRMGTLELDVPRIRGAESPYLPTFLTHRERCACIACA